jgi:hypothetical protein
VQYAWSGCCKTAKYRLCWKKGYECFQLEYVVFYVTLSNVLREHGDTGNDTCSVKYLHMFALYIQTCKCFLQLHLASHTSISHKIHEVRLIISLDSHI